MKIHAFPFLVALALAAVALSAGANDAAPPDSDAQARDSDAQARKVVEDADRIRFPADGFQVDVAISSSHDGKTDEERRYRVLSKGNDNTVVMITAPAMERGQILLMKGHDLWMFLPNVSQPVRLSLAQRLTGQVANGDLARANLAGDYDARIVRDEAIDGEQYHVLELTASERGVTYPKVAYWVRASNNWPYKAEFYSASGRLLKTCTYEQFDQLGGKVRPTRLVMVDALRPGERSVLDYSGMKPRDLPDKVFTKDYLKKLE
jgi:outer membrane lipoprotein-sorting protein